MFLSCIEQIALTFRWKKCKDAQTQHVIQDIGSVVQRVAVLRLNFWAVEEKYEKHDVLSESVSEYWVIWSIKTVLQDMLSSFSYK